MMKKNDESGRRIANSFKNKHSFSYGENQATGGMTTKRAVLTTDFTMTTSPPRGDLKLTTNDYRNYK
jgi:hypothetical protein